jgi:hypothetical protein
LITSKIDPPVAIFRAPMVACRMAIKATFFHAWIVTQGEEKRGRIDFSNAGNVFGRRRN